MSIIPITYALAFVAAVVVLWRFGGARWYWHLAAVVAALGIGLMPQIEGMQGVAYDIVVGCLFIFLFIWGAGIILGPIARNAVRQG
jgi:hypothetical protein